MNALKKGRPAAAVYAALVFLLLITSTSAAAIDYYADIEIELGPDGSATITGTTNHPALIAGETQNYTSKKGQYWLLDISLAEPFSDYIFKIILPKDAVINYVNAPSQVRIAHEDSRLTITGTGKDEPFSVQIQYSFDNTPPQNSLMELVVWFGPAIILIIMGIVLYSIGKKKTALAKSPQDQTQTYNPETLTERQKQIVDLIRRSNETVTQAMIERAIEIPKSSVSRNIDSLVRKGIIKKERRGMSNILTLLK